MKFDLFISYSRRNLEQVKAIKEQIEAAVPGVRIWFDMTGIESGEQFEQKIVGAIDESEMVLFMVSEPAMESENTRREIVYAHNKGKKILPVLLDRENLDGWFLFRFGEMDYTIWKKPEQVERLFSTISKHSESTRMAREREKQEEEKRLKLHAKAEYIEDQIRKLQDQKSGLDKELGITDDTKMEEPAPKPQPVAPPVPPTPQPQPSVPPMPQPQPQPAVPIDPQPQQKKKHGKIPAWAWILISCGIAFFLFLVICVIIGWNMDYYEEAQQAYESGNYKDALEYCELGLEADDRYCALVLGDMYSEGKGVPEDAEKAFQNYKLAAEAGIEEGQYMLAQCYYQGYGIAADPEKGYMWLKMSADQGYEDAINLLKEIESQQQQQQPEAADE